MADYKLIEWRHANFTKLKEDDLESLEEIAELCSEYSYSIVAFTADEEGLDFGSPKKPSAFIKRFDKNPEIGMISVPELIISSQKEDSVANARAERIMRGMGLQIKNHKFVAGTMFMARAKLFKTWQMLPYDATDFEEFDVSHKGGTLAHALERVLGYMIAAQGYKIASYRRSKFYFYVKVMAYKIKNFIFYKRVNSKNKLHIKICKIPVYSKQL